MITFVSLGMRAGLFVGVAATVVLGAAGCEVPATQALVLIDTDLDPGAGEIDQFGVLVAGPDGQTVHEQVFDLSGAGAVALPASFGVAPSDRDPDRQVTVEAWALFEEGEIFRTRAVTRFVEHRATRLDMFLARRCRTEARYCPEDQTCTAEGCVPVDVDERDDEGSGGVPGPVSDWAVSFPFAQRDPRQAFPYVATDRDGNVFLAGYALGGLVFDGQSEGGGDRAFGFAAALDSAGNHRWHALITPDADDPSAFVMVVGIGVDAAGVHVAGHVAGAVDFGGAWASSVGAPLTLFVATFDPLSGSVEVDTWTAGDVLFATDFEAGPAGLVLTGTFQGTLQLDRPHEAASTLGFVAVLDGEHDVQWSCTLPSSATPVEVSLGDGGEVLVGALLTETLWGQELGSGGPLVASLGEGPDRNCEAPPWVHRPGTPAPWRLFDLAAGRGGPAALVGDNMGRMSLGDDSLPGVGGLDVLLERLDTDGMAVSGFFDGAMGDDSATAVSMDRLGRVAVSGYVSGVFTQLPGTSPYVGGAADAFVVGVGPDGEHLWTQTFGSTDHENATDVVLDAATGSVVVAGVTQGTIDSLGIAPGMFVRRFVP